MIRGLYTSAIGMAAQMKRLDATSHNLANADTPGFKRDVVITQAFDDVLMRRVRDYEMRGINAISPSSDPNIGPGSLGLIISTLHRDFTPGNLQPTNRPLDLALDRSGFFQVAFTNTAGETTMKYTRGGAFTLTDGGMLITLAGHPVMNTSGSPITIPPGNISITPQGVIIVNDEVVDTINLVAFEDMTTLRPFGDNLFTTTEDTVAIAYAGMLMQGYMESSNVNVVREMAEMIALSRAYEANARMLAIADQTLGQAVTEIARR